MSVVEQKLDELNRRLVEIEQWRKRADSADKYSVEVQVDHEARISALEDKAGTLAVPSPTDAAAHPAEPAKALEHGAGAGVPAPRPDERAYRMGADLYPAPYQPPSASSPEPTPTPSVEEAFGPMPGTEPWIRQLVRGEIQNSELLAIMNKRMLDRIERLELALSPAAPPSAETLPPVPYGRHEAEMLKLIVERDSLHERLDAFVEAVGGIDVCGEHSNLNDPWAHALEVVENLCLRSLPASSTGTTISLDEAERIYNAHVLLASDVERIHRASRFALRRVLDACKPTAPSLDVDSLAKALHERYADSTFQRSMLKDWRAVAESVAEIVGAKAQPTLSVDGLLVSARSEAIDCVAGIVAESALSMTLQSALRERFEATRRYYANLDALTLQPVPSPQARELALEEAAKVCDDEVRRWRALRDGGHGDEAYEERCGARAEALRTAARDIRSLKLSPAPEREAVDSVEACVGFNVWALLAACNAYQKLSTKHGADCYSLKNGFVNCTCGHDDARFKFDSVLCALRKHLDKRVEEMKAEKLAPVPAPAADVREAERLLKELVEKARNVLVRFQVYRTPYGAISSCVKPEGDPNWVELLTCVEAVESALSSATKDGAE